MTTLSIEQIKKQYPEQWVLVGDPKLNDSEANAAIVSQLMSGVVLYASKDKRELAHKTKDLRKGYDLTVCVYTGEIPRKRLFLL